VIGLGAGTIAAWGRTGDTIRFYELNPQVVDLAHTHFSFLKDSAAAVDVVTGDGRLALEREVDAANGFAPYDVFVVDAFSGDSIPVHLLTRECFALYRRALAPDGVLALHVSNKHLDLRPVVRGLADETGLRTFEIVTSGQPAVAATSSLWMLLTGSPAFDAGPFAVTSGGGERTLIWTDAFSSVLSLLR
jgi:spermidine synthase